MARKFSIKNLKNARRAKNDEFYTQYGDIQKEIEKYLDFNPDTFRNKVVYCNWVMSYNTCKIPMN